MNLERFTGLNNGAGDELWLIDASLFIGFPSIASGIVNYSDLTGQITGFSEPEHVTKIKFRNGDLKYKIGYEADSGDDLESCVIEGRVPRDSDANFFILFGLMKKQWVIIFHTYNVSNDQRVKLMFGTKSTPAAFRITSRESGDSFVGSNEIGLIGLCKKKNTTPFLVFD